MIQLLINNQIADLKPTTTITLTEMRDLFNLAIIGGSVSIPFDIAPNPKNRKTLGFIDNPSSSTTFEQEYDASLYFCDAITLEGKFVLRKARKNEELNGYFKTDAGALSEFSDTNIRDIINESIVINNRTETSTFNSANGDYVFPNLYEVTEKDNAVGSGQVERWGFFNPVPVIIGVTSESYRICPKLTKLIAAVFSQLGYTPIYNFSDSSFLQAIWIDGTPNSTAFYFSGGPFTTPITNFPRTFELNTIAPDITLSEFLNSIRANFNLEVLINAETKTVTFSRVVDLINSNSEDFTDYVIPHPTIERIDDTDFFNNEITFCVEPENQLTEVELLPSVIRYQDAIAAVGDLNKVRLVEFDSYYYQVQELENPVSGSPTYEYIPFANNTVPQIVVGLSSNVESKLPPLPNQEVQFRNYTGIELVNNGGNAALKINGLSFVGITAPGNGKMRIAGDDIPYDRQFVDITAVSFGLITLNMAYISDVTVDAQYKRAITNPCPIINDSYSECAKGGLSIYHGIQDKTDLSDTYAYASSSVYDTDFVTQLSNAALIFGGTYGLYAIYYQGVVAKFSTANKKATFSMWLPIALLGKRKTNFVIVEGVKYLVTQFKYKMTNRSKQRVACEIEARIA